ncbi:hypothetical protein [Streptomyces tendae]|uniref:hypothetical protein n=1 Tax=Streptomyces tendae TaxID=1932 RepID=UPI00384CA4D1
MRAGRPGTRGCLPPALSPRRRGRRTAVRSGPDSFIGFSRRRGLSPDCRCKAPAVGETAPDGLAPQDVIRTATSMTGLTPQDLDLVEAHGTGRPPAPGTKTWRGPPCRCASSKPARSPATRT